MYKIVFLDLDGTLLDHNKLVPQKAKHAIQKLKENNVEVVIATGRAPYNFAPIAKEIGVESFICFNGAYVCYKGKLVQTQAFDKKNIGKLVNISREKNHPLVFLNEVKAVSNYLDHPDVLKSFTDLKLDYKFKYQPDFWKTTDIYQVMLYCQKHEERFYLEHIPEFSFVRWHDLSMDVMPTTVSKATGIKTILTSLGLSNDEAVAFGDGLNDREMLSYVGMGVAMGNAHEEVKSYADYVTKAVDEGGLSYALEHLGLI